MKTRLILTGATVLAVVVLFAAWNAGAGRVPGDAGPCNSVSSPDCQPYVDLIRQDLGTDAGGVASIRSGSWCGQSSCQQVFGFPGPQFRLVVTLDSGRALTYQCGVWWSGSSDAAIPAGSGELALYRNCSRETGAPVTPPPPPPG